MPSVAITAEWPHSGIQVYEYTSTHTHTHTISMSPSLSLSLAPNSNFVYLSVSCAPFLSTSLTQFWKWLTSRSTPTFSNWASKTAGRAFQQLILLLSSLACSSVVPWYVTWVMFLTCGDQGVVIEVTKPHHDASTGLVALCGGGWHRTCYGPESKSSYTYWYLSEKCTHLHHFHSYKLLDSCCCLRPPVVTKKDKQSLIWCYGGILLMGVQKPNTFPRAGAFSITLQSLKRRGFHKSLKPTILYATRTDLANPMTNISSTNPWS